MNLILHYPLHLPFSFEGYLLNLKSLYTKYYCLVWESYQPCLSCIWRSAVR